MQEKDIQSIQQAERAIRTLGNIRIKFERNLKENGAFPDFVGQVNLQNGIFVGCFGVEARGQSRIVRVNDNEFYLEVVFKRKRGETEHELCRFYLDQEGHVSEAIKAGPICAYDAPEASREIFTRVAFAVLNSGEFDLETK